MRSAVNVLGITGGMFGAIFGAIAVFVGGAGAAFGAERGGDAITELGFVAVLLALAGIVGGILAHANRTASIVLLLVPGVLGFVFIGAWWTLPGILFIVGGILEVNSRPSRVAPIMAAGPVTRSYAPPAAAAPEMAAAPVVEEAPMATSDVRRTSGLIDIESIGPAYADKLEAVGLRTTDDLLQAAASPKGREVLAAGTDISDKLILRWVNMADLFRIKGLGEQCSDLLEAAGVDTVPELAQRRADNLTKKMAEVNEQKQLVRRLPTEDQVAGWIESAKGLPRVVIY